jgi:hypothetical protein
LDNFKLSSIFFIKCFQIFSIVGFLFTLIITSYNSIFVIDTISYINDKDNVNLHGHISLNREAAKEIGQGLNTIGSNIGLGATIAGVSSAVAKGVAKSTMPSIQKAGVILGAGLIGGLSHSKISTINRNNVILEGNIKNNYSSNYSDLNSSINKFVDDTTQSSPLQDLLLNLEITNYVCISLIIILVIQILFKFNIKDKVSLKLSFILGNNFNNKLEYYLNKIIRLNKKMSTVYI